MNNTINVTRSSMPDFEEYCEEIRELWLSRWLTNSGVKHRELENELESYLGAKHVTLLVNGHMALEAILEAYGLKGEIITTPFTYASTTHAIVRSGCTPVFCDINPDDYTLDADKLEALITDKTVAVLPVHVYGNLCDTDKISAIAEKHKLKVIYDAAHAFGVKKNGVSAALFGDAAMFSFHATKVFHCIEGGALTYTDDALCEKLNAIKSFGYTSPDCVPLVGGNAKMNEFSAAMGICNLRHLSGEIEKRKAAAERYNTRLGGIEGITLNRIPADVTPNYAYYPVVFHGYKYSRDEVFSRLAANGITARKYFYPLTSTFECYAGKPGFNADDTPIAKRIANEVLTLPMYADLTVEDVDRICDIILG